MKKGYSISGGSTKIAALAGASIYTLRDYQYQPDYICGISSGGILSVPLALGLYDELISLVQNFTYEDVFSIKPVNNKGKLRLEAIWRVITGKESLGAQDNLIETMSKLVPENLFEHYKRGKYAPCYIGSVEFKTGSRSYVNAKELNYDDFLLAVKATSSIPVFVEAVEGANDGYYYDGGIRDHIGSHWLMEHCDMNEHISLYSRPENYDIIDKNWKPKNAAVVLQRTLDIMMVEISKNDELKEDVISEKKNIYNRKIFMPYILSDETYELSPEKLKEWYNIGYEQAKAVLH